MKNNKKLILKSRMIFLLITISLIVFFHPEAKGQYPNSCNTCTQNYSVCRLEVPQCVEQKINDCRNSGQDESFCENLRSTFEEVCLNTCYTTFENCWTDCSTDLPTPPKEYTSPECPAVSAWMDGISEIGEVYGSVSKAQTEQIGGFPVIMHIDGNWVESTFANEPTGNPFIKGLSWKIPLLFRDGEEHILDAYVEDVCYGNQFLIPFDWSPIFVLYH